LHIDRVTQIRIPTRKGWVAGRLEEGRHKVKVVFGRFGPNILVGQVKQLKVEIKNKKQLKVLSEE
jgi:hypothetical protein